MVLCCKPGTLPIIVHLLQFKKRRKESDAVHQGSQGRLILRGERRGRDGGREESKTSLWGQRVKEKERGRGKGKRREVERLAFKKRI